MGLFDDLHRTGIYRGYERHVVMLEPILRRMGERGIPVNPDVYAKVERILTEAKAARLAEIQSLVPAGLKPHSPKDGYKRTPKDITGMIVLPNGRYAREKTWKPSNKGLIAYIRARGHKVPTHIKTKAPTTAAMEILRLYRETKDPLYNAVLKYRKASTVLDNHMENWRPEPDGRVHPTFYFDPATGQLSARRPNVQNAPAHDDPEIGGYAREFRSMVRARDGYKIIEFDYSRFHVQTLAFESRDLALMRMGRLDIHSFVTAHFLRLPEAPRLFDWGDEELAEYLARVKRDHKHVRNAQVKHALLGYNNGMGYKKLWVYYMEFFNNMGEAKRMMELMDDLFPEAKRYRERICMQAHDQGYLISRHGYIRFFWEVFRVRYGRDGLPIYSHGEDHEAALCFFTQNDAHGELKDRIITLAERGLDERYGLINTIHDSLKFECPDALVNEAIREVKLVMEAPSPILIDPVSAPAGLAVKVDAKVGQDWSNCVEVP